MPKNASFVPQLRTLSRTRCGTSHYLFNANCFCRVSQSVFRAAILSLFMCVFLTANIATASAQQLRTDTIVAPDGKIIVRRFEKGAGPHQTILVCSNNWDRFFSPLQQFAAYVFADKGYKILDGRDDDLKFDRNATTFAYFGTYPDQTAFDECLNKYPKLKYFVEYNRVIKPRARIVQRIETWAKKGDLAISSGQSFLDRSSSGKLANYVGFCFTGDPYCDNWPFPTLFLLNGYFCEENDECSFIHRRSGSSQLN